MTLSSNIRSTNCEELLISQQCGHPLDVVMVTDAPPKSSVDDAELHCEDIDERLQLRLRLSETVR